MSIERGQRVVSSTKIPPPLSAPPPPPPPPGGHLASATTEDLKAELARRTKPATTVPALLPREKIRKFGPFYFHVYVATHDLLDGDRRLPLWLFVGARRTHRGARRLATQELARRAAARAAHQSNGETA